MSEIGDEQRCTRSDGRGWRCRRPVSGERSFCETHIQQAQLRQKRQPVPHHLKLQRPKRTVFPKTEDPSSNATVRRRKRNIDSVSDIGSIGINKKVKNEFLDLKMGKMEISPASFPVDSRRRKVLPEGKVGNECSGSGFGRTIRSKNCEPVPIATVKRLPGIKENVKAVGKKKTVKKCHWCKLGAFCRLVKCLTCKKNFFCQDCINQRLYCEKTIKRECPVCLGECSCRSCSKGKAKQLKTKEPVIHDLEEDVLDCDSEKEMTVVSCEKKSDFDTTLHLHMIQELLPLITKINQEKMIVLDTESKTKGTHHAGVGVKVTGYTRKECSFCNACIPDVHRSCDYCGFSLCLVCCHEYHDGHLHSSLESLKKTKMIRSKCSKSKSWRLCLDGSISCPPRDIGGCGGGLLKLTSLHPFSLTKDLEEGAKQVLHNFQFKKLDALYDSSRCLLCEENGEAGLYFSTKQECQDDSLVHFTRHWRKGQPVVIRDVFQGQPDLNWDFGFMLCEYLEKSAESHNNTEARSTKSTRDWCEIKFGREQIFSGGITHKNVWNEFLIYKLRFSLDFLQDHFPEHHNAIIRSLPVQQYMNPFTGFLNLGTYSPYQTSNSNMGSNVSIYYGGSDSPLDADVLSNLRVHAYDVVNILLHATDRPISERALNDVKVSMHKYNTQDHLTDSNKFVNRNRLEDMFASSSTLDATPNHEAVLLSDESESDEEFFAQDASTSGAHWDIFRREDVPMLLKYLRKYSDRLSGSHGSSKKVVHPLFDDVFYLNADHKIRLKEEFNVDAMSFEQAVGEAVIIPAGCAYQVKKLKSCVNVVFEFMSPESALESVKVSDEVRLLPVNHKAKGNTVKVKEMAINRMQAALEDMREVLVPQPE